MMLHRSVVFFCVVAEVLALATPLLLLACELSEPREEGGARDSALVIRRSRLMERDATQAEL